MIEIGRVCVVNFGDNAGKICVVVDVIDANRALVDGPASQTGVTRQSIPMRQLSLTNIKIAIRRGAKSASIEKVFKEADVNAAYAATSWAKKAAKSAKRSEMGDFDRFKCMVLRKKRSAIISKELEKLKKAALIPGFVFQIGGTTRLEEVSLPDQHLMLMRMPLWVSS